MPRRSVDWNVGLAEDLRDPQLARGFLLAAMEDDLPIQLALGKIVRAMGVKEFAEKIGMAAPNLLRVIDPAHNPTLDSLNRVLKPFELKISLAPIERPKARRRA